MTDGRTIRIRIGDREHDKPWHPSCPACTSPVLLQLDTLLSYGWTYARISDYTRSMKPAGVRVISAGALRAHVPHLAAPHLEARRQLEEDVTARGASVDEGSSPVAPADLARLAVRRAYQALQDGGEANIRDAVAILRLQLEIDRHEVARQLAGSAEQWQAATRELLWIARKHLGTRWPDFVADLRSSETLRAIMPPGREEVPGDGAEAAD